MSHLPAILVRLAALAVVVIAYTSLVVPMMSEQGDANIGAGLLAFAIVIVISLIWSVVDGRRAGLAPTAVRWAIVAVVLSIGWVLLLVVVEGDDSMTTREAVGAAFGLVPFTIVLVLVPSLVGAAIGQSLHRES